MKERFKSAMVRLYGKQVPDSQLKDLARTFLAGVLLGAELSDRKDIGINISTEYMHILEKDWQPDDSWRWWKL